MHPAIKVFREATRNCPVKGLILDFHQEDDIFYIIMYRSNFEELSDPQKLSVTEWIGPVFTTLHAAGFPTYLWVKE